MYPSARKSARRSASRTAHSPNAVGRSGWRNCKPGAFLCGVAGFVRMMRHSVRHHLHRPFSFWQDRGSVRVLRILAASVAGMAALAIIVTAVQSFSDGSQSTGMVDTTAEGITPELVQQLAQKFVPQPAPELEPVPSIAPVIVPENTPKRDIAWPDIDITSGMTSDVPHAGGPERRGALGTMSSLNLDEGLRSSFSDGSAYNESEEAPLADVARQVDAALLQTLARFDLAVDALDLLHSETRFTADNLVYPFLRLRVRLPEFATQSKAFTDSLAEALGVWAPAARLHREGEGLLLVEVDHAVTHSILLPTAQVRPDAAPQSRVAPLPSLVIIIDDIGEDLEVARTLLDLPFPVTLSVWPRSRWAAYIGTLAHERGGQVFLHQPMQPVQAGVYMGEGGLRVSMDAAEITTILRANMRLVPNVTGINNHMGSRFTSSRPAVRLFCQSLHSIRPDIMVLDSLTLGASVLYDEALAQGFVAFRRALFLDVVRGKEAILKELDHGMELARRDGQAIVIGHPHSDTLAALLAWRGYLARDVAIVPLTLRSDHTNGGKPATDTEMP